MPNTLEEAAAYAKSKVMRELQENGQIGGIKQEKIYLFPEQKNVLEDIGDGTGAGVLVGEFANVGETPPPKIHIVIDGVIYERENIPDESRPTTTGVYGNGSYFGGVGANNDNFAVMLSTEANSLFAVFIDPETQMPLLAGATVTFGIYTQTETLHPIDPKYLLKVIDLDKYGSETTITTTLLTLLESGGGNQTVADMGSLFADLNRESPIRVQFTFMDTVVIVNGATLVKVPGNGVGQMCFECVINNNGTVLRVAVTISSNGHITLGVSTV